MHNVQCAYVTINTGRQVHYRQSGSGPALVLLHPSPQCSQAMFPAVKAFSEVCSCFALDTPGYGLSDAMVQADATIGDYAETILNAIDALGIDKFYLYGSATGSQIAIEIGKRYPSRIILLLLDACGHISDEDRERILDGYMPGVKPRLDGGHLLTYWDMAYYLSVSFPWYSGKSQHRLPIDVPPADIVQTIVLRYLNAGEGYDTAYRTAFHIEKRDHMDGLTIPTTVMRWESSIALEITDKLIEFGLPDCVEVLHADAGIEARYGVQVDAIKKTLTDDVVETDIVDISPPVNTSEANTLLRTYLNADQYQLHTYTAVSGEARHLLILHGAASSSKQFVELAHACAGKRPVTMIDIPGHGATPPLADAQALDLEGLASPIVSALKANNIEDVDIIGFGLGGGIGIVLNQQIKVGHLYIVDPLPYSTEEQTDFIAKGIPDFAPQMDGTHLIKAWSMVRNERLFWPWYDRRYSTQRIYDADLDPQSLHLQTLDVIKSAPCYAAIKKLELSLNWPDLISSTQSQISLVYTQHHPHPDRVKQLAGEIYPLLSMATADLFDLVDC